MKSPRDHCFGCPPLQSDIRCKSNVRIAAKHFSSDPMSSDDTLGSAALVNGYATSAKPHVLRIMKDIREFYTENPDSMHIIPDETDVTTVHALIRGPERTPYHNGFFYFVMRFPSDYPLRPPSVKLITTGGRTVRFNPNLYSDGKVCLSILGTWTGPAWTAAQTLFTTLLSIQSLMNERPYHNEPGFELGRTLRRNPSQMTTDAENYNNMITHETIRVAVIGMLDRKSVDAYSMPKELKDVMISFFKKNHQFYEDLIQSQMKMDGQPVIDPFRDPSRPKKFDFKDLLAKLQKLKESLGICDSTAATATAEAAHCSAQEGQSSEPSVESYKSVADKMLATIAVSKPKPQKEDEDNWDDLIDQMNDELNDDEPDLYVSDNEEAIEDQA